MKTTSHYIIADFTFSVTADTQIIEGMTSFKPFRTETADLHDNLFIVDVECSANPQASAQGLKADEEICNDFGKIRMYLGENEYYFEVRFGGSPLPHTMAVNTEFTHASICLNSSDKYQTTALSTLLHIMFSMAIIPHGGIMTHASCVIHKSNGYLFLGKSGTGKSTHAGLWIKNYADCTLLNDDNPVIRLFDSGIYVYGSPWSGKTPCYKNLSAPLRGIARLEQSDVNQFTILIETAAFACLLPSCSVIHSNGLLSNILYQSLIAICEKVKIGLLKCRPDNDAARVCHESLMSN